MAVITVDLGFWPSIKLFARSSLAEIPAAFLGQLCDWASAHGMGHEDQDAPAADSIRHCHVLPDSPSVPFSMALSTSRIIFCPSSPQFNCLCLSGAIVPSEQA